MWLRGVIVSAALTALLVAVPHARHASQPSSTVPAVSACLAATYHKPNPALDGSSGVPPGPGGPPPRLATLARGTWDGNGLTNVRDLFSADATTEASRIVASRCCASLDSEFATSGRAPTGTCMC
jgi:hypothetical protein